MASNKFLDPPPAATRDKASFELLRVWVAEQGQHVSLRSGTWEDPFAWGIVLADLARHIVNACSKAFGPKSIPRRMSQRVKSRSKAKG
jgi:hypothetical protein